MVAFDNAGRYNADHPKMPLGITQHQGCRWMAAILPGNAVVYRLFDRLLEGAPFLVHGIEALRKKRRFLVSSSEQESNALSGRPQAATGIQPRRQLKTNLAYRRRFPAPATDLAQGLQTALACLCQLLQTV